MKKGLTCELYNFMLRNFHDICQKPRKQCLQNLLKIARVLTEKSAKKNSLAFISDNPALWDEHNQCKWNRKGFCV